MSPGVQRCLQTIGTLDHQQFGGEVALNWLCDSLTGNPPAAERGSIGAYIPAAAQYGVRDLFTASRALPRRAPTRRGNTFQRRRIETPNGRPQGPSLHILSPLAPTILRSPLLCVS